LVYITGTIEQHKSEKTMVSHSTLQSRCLHTINTDMSKALSQRPNYYTIHPSLYRDPAVREK